MNKETFLSMPPHKRVVEINKMLENATLKEVADKIGIAYSTFLKEMTVGDYVFIQRENRYFKFIRDGEKGKVQTLNESYEDVLQYLKDNFDQLKQMLNSEKRPPLVLDQRIYSKNAVFVNKSIKMNEEIYERFTEFCNENFPQFRLQDLIAQSLLDFIEKYCA